MSARYNSFRCENCNIIQAEDRTYVRPTSESSLLKYMLDFQRYLQRNQQKSTANTIRIEPIVMLVDLATQKPPIQVSPTAWWLIAGFHCFLSMHGGGLIIRMCRSHDKNEQTAVMLRAMLGTPVPVVYSEAHAIDLWGDLTELYTECAGKFQQSKFGRNTDLGKWGTVELWIKAVRQYLDATSITRLPPRKTQITPKHDRSHKRHAIARQENKTVSSIGD